MLADSAFLFIIGLVLAGIISLYLKPDVIARLSGRSKFQSVIRASLVGIPLPLCSCSVLPVAAQLRESGMGKSGTTSFLISTPESGVDSIALTYSLTDPVLTVARPVAAFLTAFTAGAIQTEDSPSNPGPETQIAEAQACNCEDDCTPEQSDAVSQQSLPARLWSGVRYAFTDLIGDLAPYLLTGFLLAGLLEAILGPNIESLSTAWKTGWPGYVGAIVAGLPMYICATSSTPLAAVLLGFGFSPGAVLVFLLVGPATNVAALVVLKRILGAAALMRYLAAIVVVAVLCGVALDQVYSLLGVTASYHAGDGVHDQNWLYIISAVILGCFIVYYSFRKFVRRLA